MPTERKCEITRKADGPPYRGPRFRFSFRPRPYPVYAYPAYGYYGRPVYYGGGCVFVFVFLFLFLAFIDPVFFAIFITLLVVAIVLIVFLIYGKRRSKTGEEQKI